MIYLERLDKNYFNEKISDAVAQCNRTIFNLFQAFDIKEFDYSKHKEFYPVTVTFNNEGGDVIKYEEIQKLVFKKEFDIITVIGETMSGYIDSNYGGYFDVADKVGDIYRLLAEVAYSEDGFDESELADGYIPQEEQDRIADIVDEKVDFLANAVNYQMHIVDGNDIFDFIIIATCYEDISVLRRKADGVLFIPSADEDGVFYYPNKFENVGMYQWETAEVNIPEKTEKIMFNNEMKEEKYDELTAKRLNYLAGEGNEKCGNVFFNGITFVWHKNHTICVKSPKDAEEGHKEKSYVAVYKHHTDVKPCKFYAQTLTCSNFD